MQTRCEQKWQKWNTICTRGSSGNKHTKSLVDGDCLTRIVRIHICTDNVHLCANAIYSFALAKLFCVIPNQDKKRRNNGNATAVANRQRRHMGKPSHFLFVCLVRAFCSIGLQQCGAVCTVPHLHFTTNTLQIECWQIHKSTLSSDVLPHLLCHSTSVAQAHTSSINLFCTR